MPTDDRGGLGPACAIKVAYVLERGLLCASAALLLLVFWANLYTLSLVLGDHGGTPPFPEAVAFWYGCQPGAEIFGLPLIVESLLSAVSIVTLMAVRHRAWAGIAGAGMAIALVIRGAQVSF